VSTMNRTKQIAIATAVTGTLLAGVFSAVPANAATSSGQDQTALRDWFTSQGVSNATQDALIAKLDSGKLLDSMSGAVKPDTTTTTQTATALVNRSVYPDGSVAVTSLETPTKTGTAAGARSLQPQQITGCKESNGGGYVVETNCKVEIASGPYDLWFSATYERYTGTGS
jgi:hypothetical protein